MGSTFMPSGRRSWPETRSPTSTSRQRRCGKRRALRDGRAGQQSPEDPFSRSVEEYAAEFAGLAAGLDGEMLDAAELEIRRAELTEIIDQDQQRGVEAKRRLDAEDSDYSEQKGRSAAHAEKRLLPAANNEQTLGQLDDDQAELLRVDRAVRYLQEPAVTEMAHVFYLAERGAVRANANRHLALRRFPLPFLAEGMCQI